jgi:membrane fusion protein (multidrug efflux system)
VVPQQAVIRDPKTAAAAVYVIGADGKVAVVPIQDTEVSGPNWIVRSGALQDGAKVIVDGATRAMVPVAPGSVVRAVEWKPAAPAATATPAAKS